MPCALITAKYRIPLNIDGRQFVEIIYLLIPLSLVLLGVAIWAFFWAIKSGQFDDLDSPALSILDDPEKRHDESLR
jgi:cbb3-type cytochrome oxidase maturation protein